MLPFIKSVSRIELSHIVWSIVRPEGLKKRAGKLPFIRSLHTNQGLRYKKKLTALQMMKNETLKRK